MKIEERKAASRPEWGGETHPGASAARGLWAAVTPGTPAGPVRACLHGLRGRTWPGCAPGAFRSLPSSEHRWYTLLLPRLRAGPVQASQAQAVGLRWLGTAPEVISLAAQPCVPPFAVTGHGSVASRLSWVWAQAKGLLFVHVHPDWQLETCQCSILWGCWRICGELWC